MNRVVLVSLLGLETRRELCLGHGCDAGIAELLLRLLLVLVLVLECPEARQSCTLDFLEVVSVSIEPAKPVELQKSCQRSIVTKALGQALILVRRRKAVLLPMQLMISFWPSQGQCRPDWNDLSQLLLYCFAYGFVSGTTVARLQDLLLQRPAPSSVALLRSIGTRFGRQFSEDFSTYNFQAFLF